MARQGDFLDELVGERSERNPDFPALVEAAPRRRQPLRALSVKCVEVADRKTVRVAGSR